MKVLHILNSDFGAAATMGYRSYQVAKHSEADVKVFCRANKSDMTENVSVAYPFARLYSRATQAVLKVFGPSKVYRQLKKFEINLFNLFAKKKILTADIIHFFYHDEGLIKFAKNNGKTVLLEAFSHPDYLKKMRRDGIKFDSDDETSDDHSIPCYQLCDLIISPSHWVTKTLEYANLPKNKIVYIPYGVHQQTAEKKQENNKLVVIFAGGGKRTKGIIELLDSVKSVEQHAIELHIFGRIHNSVNKEIQQRVEATDNIFLRGFSDNIIEEYKKADVYVYPSYFEGSSKTVFEAMSCSLPVIATLNAGSIVRDGKDGFIVDVANTEQITDKLRWFIEDRTRVKEMGNVASEYASKFTWEVYANKVSDLYNKAVK